METQEFTDVTLISDDLHQYKVHKFILSACSTAFKKILASNSLNSSIYLRGIQHEELESVLQFIYLGEATFYHERMNEFLNVAKNLDIKELGKNVVDDIEENKVDIKNHGGIKPYKCQQCNFQAANKGNFTYHMQTKHDGIKYPCQKCSFLQIQQLLS